MQRVERYKVFAQATATLGILAVWISFCTGHLEAQKKPPKDPIDLNSASMEQLEQLPGIGPSTAKAIVQFREKSGPFERVEDLLAIHGISKKRLEKLRPYVIIVPPTQKTHSRIGAQPCLGSDFYFLRWQFFVRSELS